MEHGRLPLEKIVAAARINVIRAALDKIGGDRLAPLKEYLGEEYGYGEIRMVISAGHTPGLSS